MAHDFTKTSGFAHMGRIDLSHLAATPEDFIRKFVDTCSRLLDKDPDGRNWQEYMVTLMGEAEKMLIAQEKK